ncbi:MAG: type II toxin-antitoxin system VapC family toxin, partial [Nocardioidaceae bacterium]|nr:type II toxin-antitoxin system VapC family toxin [Nocardioidaceae bacterium]
VKLIFAEAESAALDRFVGANGVAASALSRVELRRVALRADPRQMRACEDLLASCFEVSLTPALLDHAGGVEPASLRSLDAIHLASALVLGDELESFVAYDDRLLAAAQELELTTRSPR